MARIIIVGIFILSAFTTYTLADTINVPGDSSTIQGGINGASDGDTVLVDDGTYVENIDFLGKAILVVSNNGPQSTIIKIEHSGIPVVYFHNSEEISSKLEGFTVDGDSSYWGIHCDNSSPYIYNNIIKNHEVGIRADNGSPFIRKNEISYCEHIDISPHNGGAIRIVNASNTVIDSNYIHHNWANVAAGLMLDYSENVIIERNLFCLNNSDYMGAVDIYTCEDVDFINNTLAYNSGPSPYRGSIFIYHGINLNILNNIIAFNNEWGLYLEGTSQNLIVDYNDFHNNTAGDIYGATPGSWNIYSDPLFVGGDPFSYHLQAGSPCIDAGDPNSPLDPDGTIADMGAFYSGDIVTTYGLDIGDIFGENSLPVAVPVTANGLADQDIAGAEFHINFDNTCLQYDSTTSGYLFDMLVNVVGNEIHILWEDYANPVIVPESTAIIDLRFTVLGQLGDSCSIDWFGNNEVVDSIGNVVSGLTFSDGSVEVIEFHSVSGRVVYYDMITELENVNVELSGDWNAAEVTDENGFYEFESLFPGDFMICPSRTEDDPGVTVGDVVKIRRHLVELELFDTPYKYIAADVNESDFVSIADIIKIRRYLASLEDLPSGNWTFVDSAFTITNDNWTNAPECIELTIWDSDLTDSSFIGIRMGDVDMTNGVAQGGGIPVITDIAVLDLIDVSGAPEDTVMMALDVEGFVDVAGLEIHIEFPQNRVEFIEINSTVISDLTYNVVGGEFHLVWEDIENVVNLPNNSNLLNLGFRIIETVPGQIPILFTSAYVVNIVGQDFTVDARDGNIILTPSSTDDISPLPIEYSLRQNYPNPFNAETQIKFELSQSSQVTLEIYDLLGRRITTLIDRQFDAGYHHVDWNASSYPSGIYFYTIRAGEFSKARKMMLLK